MSSSQCEKTNTGSHKCRFPPLKGGYSNEQFGVWEKEVWDNCLGDQAREEGKRMPQSVILSTVTARDTLCCSQPPTPPPCEGAKRELKARGRRNKQTAVTWLRPFHALRYSPVKCMENAPNFKSQTCELSQADTVIARCVAQSF